MMDVRKLLGNLPDDPREAYVVVCSRVEDEIEKLPILLRENGEDTENMLMILNKMCAKFQLALPFTPGESQLNSYYLEKHYNRAKEIQKVISKEKFERAKAVVSDQVGEILDHYLDEIQYDAFGYAELNQDEKTVILSLIEKIRILVEESDISSRKKESIFDKLSALHKEVMQDRTYTEKFFSFWGEFAFLIGDMAEKAKPAIDETKEILKIVMGSRAKREHVALPPSRDLPRLPSPTDDNEGDDDGEDIPDGEFDEPTEV